jgi:uracil phosphoribosyltransferase
MAKSIFKKQTEVEVKLNVEDDKIFKEILNLEKIAGFEVGSGHPGECQDVYYDTKTRLFWQNRLTLRTRKDKEGWWLFFKQDKKPPKPLFQRDEYHQKLSPKELAAFKQRKSGLALLRKIEALFGVREKDLQIALTLNNKRTNINLKKGREEALLSLDRVLYREGQKSAFSWSIEIEARRTSQKSIKKIAQWLKKKYSLSYSYLSKYEKGLQLLEEINFAEISRILASVPKNRVEKAKIGEYIGVGKIVELQRENPEIAINLAILRADYLLNQDRISGEVFRKYAIQVAEEITEATLEKEQIGPKQRKKIVIMGPWRAGLSIAGVYADKGFKNFWHIGARRNEKTLKTEIYYMAYPKVIDQTRPGNNKGIRVIITDPMLATGNTVIDSIKRLKRQGILEKNIKVNCVVSAPEGLVKILRRFPEVKIYAVAVDEKLDRKGYIVPGLGDFGDKYFDGITLKEIVDRWVKPGLLGLADLEKLFKKLEL